MSKHEAFYHVFLNFRGETRNEFTCFLYEALKAEGFKVFMDKSEVEVGDEVRDTIEEGIKNSMSAMVIFSPDYAKSTWCLDELVLILNRLKSSRYFIIPIFYNVRSRDIKHQLGNYGIALKKHRERHGDDKVEIWRQALVEVGNILAEHVERPHNTFIQRVVKSFREKMAAKFRECHLPIPNTSSMQKNSPLQSPTPEASEGKVILYTTDVGNGLSAKCVRKFLSTGHVVFEERNCSKEPKYFRELLGYDKVRFPMVVVNGKDLCGEEQAEGLDDFKYKCELVSVLKMIYGRRQFSQYLGEIDQKLDRLADKLFD